MACAVSAFRRDRDQANLGIAVGPSRQGRRAAFGAIALVFVLAVLVLGEVAAWLALYLRFPAIETTLILQGHQPHRRYPVWLAGREVIAQSCRARSLAGSAAVARCRAWGTFTCGPCPGREYPSASLAQEPIAGSQIVRRTPAVTDVAGRADRAVQPIIAYQERL